MGERKSTGDKRDGAYTSSISASYTNSISEPLTSFPVSSSSFITSTYPLAVSSRSMASCFRVDGARTGEKSDAVDGVRDGWRGAGSEEWS
eukprot:1458274-Rhodomonas_salina.1